MNYHRALVPNGTLPISLGWKGAWKAFEVIGGPFDAFNKKTGQFGIAVREEGIKPGQAHMQVRIKDFGVPQDPKEVEHALYAGFSELLKGRPVYVGCMGGFGRTGLFMALMAKAAGITDPVLYVRSKYVARAVETAAQEKYVAEFDTSAITKWLYRKAWKKRLFLA